MMTMMTECGGCQPCHISRSSGLPDDGLMVDVGGAGGDPPEWQPGRGWKRSHEVDAPPDWRSFRPPPITIWARDESLMFSPARSASNPRGLYPNWQLFHTDGSNAAGVDGITANSLVRGTDVEILRPPHVPRDDPYGFPYDRYSTPDNPRGPFGLNPGILAPVTNAITNILNRRPTRFAEHRWELLDWNSDPRDDNVTYQWRFQPPVYDREDVGGDTDGYSTDPEEDDTF